MVDHSPRQCAVCGDFHCLAGCVPLSQCKAKLPACRPERVNEVLEDFAANRDDQDIYKVAAELRGLFGEELAEERRKEMTGRSD